MVEAAASTSVLSLFGLNGPLFAAQLANFLVVLFVVQRFVYKPLLKAMDARAERIQTGLSNAEAAQGALKKAEKEASTIVRLAEEKAHALLEKTREEAEMKRRELLGEARVELERQIEQSKERIGQEREMMLKSARKELSELVIRATDKVTEEVLQERDQRILLEGAVKKILA